MSSNKYQNVLNMIINYKYIILLFHSLSLAFFPLKLSQKLSQTTIHHFSSVAQIITFGWRSLEQRLVMFYKTVHGLVEIPLPFNIQR